MIPVIQIFKSVAHIPKPFYNTEIRKYLENWNNVISKVGFLEDKTLHLPIECKQIVDIGNSDLIILQDINGFNKFDILKKIDSTPLPENYKAKQKESILNQYKEHFSFSVVNKPWKFELFQIDISNDNMLNIYFLSHKLHGIPKREDHKIGTLKEGQSLRFKINSKDDFLYSEGSQRTFFENDFVFQFVGFADNIEYKALNQIEMTKFIPEKTDKLVDERKILK